jgi:DNA topoisomerase IA
MSTEEHENTRLDKQVQDIVKTRTVQKDELKKLLEEKGLPVRGTAKDLIKRAEENGISSKATMATVG